MLRLDSKERADLWRQVAQIIEDYVEHVEELPVDSRARPADVKAFLSAIDFDRPWSPEQALDFVAEGARRFHVHNSSSRYFGLFVPPPTTMGIAGDMLTSAFNLVLGGWALSPFGVELERLLIQKLAAKFGYAPEHADGLFTAGGTEANHTALLCALHALSPAIREHGLAAFGKQPLVYASRETHHSIHKVAMACGLGLNAVREIDVDRSFRMDADHLESAIKSDKANGKCPCMVVATVGSTNAGAIDPLPRIAEIAKRNSLWFHADAAWGGAAVLVPELRSFATGIETADSITFDVHKWLAVPMTAGIFVTRHHDVLQRTFNVSGPYMPSAASDAAIDPFRHSMQWSRPCRGLKVLLSFAVSGWQGHEKAIREQVRIGTVMRAQLERSGWSVVNDTPLPLVCFQDGTSPAGRSRAFLDDVCRNVLDSGRAWLSVTNLAGQVPALRACVTSFLTQEKDIQELIEVLDHARSTARTKLTGS